MTPMKSEPRWVSIHARSRAGDPRLLPIQPNSRCFNPRPLTSGRHQPISSCKGSPKFQSTPAHERATRTAVRSTRRVDVSIHARSRAGDPLPCVRRYALRLFQSTPAHERATEAERAMEWREGFNPRPLTSGRPVAIVQHAECAKFQSTPAHERATQTERASARADSFNPRPLTSGRPRNART